MRSIWKIVGLTSSLILTSTGCGFLMPGSQPASTAGSSPAVSDEQKQVVRKQEAEAEKLEAQMGNIEEEQTERMEKDLVKALKLALGQQPQSPGLPPPESSSTVVKELRAAKIKLYLEPVVDQDGKPVADQFLQVKDSYTDRVQQLSRKMMEKKATPAETKEVTSGAKYAMKLQDIKMQVLNVSMVTMQSNSQVQTSAMTTMLRVAGMVRTRKTMEMELDDADYAKIAKWLAKQRRVELIAASSMGMLATYQAVINDGGNPQALDALAEHTAKAFPLKPTVSNAEAKEYVANLKGNVLEVKGRYEGMMRKIHGDAKYERQFKSSIDAMFAQAAGAQNQKSVSQIAAESQSKYNEDLEKCARGEPVSPGSLVGPARCKEARAARKSGQPIPASLGAGEAEKSEGGGIGSLLGGAASMFPALAIVSASLEGIQALAKGDPQAALTSAIAMAPGGGMVKEGLGMAAKLLR
jgi:hypothetical protein